MNWDDLRFVLAVAREGSLSGAARVLGVNHSTVFRRLNAIESALDARLFERLPSGYAPTAAGEDLRAAAERIEAEAAAAERRLAGRDLRLEGDLRLTAPDTMALTFLPECLAGFRRAYPGIRIELSVSNVFANLTRREADIALRPTNRPPDTLVGRRLCRIAFAVYGAEAYLADHGGLEPATHDWIAPDESLGHLDAARWMADRVPEAQLALRCDSLLAMREAARAGFGLALLACYLGDPEPGLVRLETPEVAFSTELWLLTHEDLRHGARVRACLDFLAGFILERRDLLEGRS